MLTKKGKTYNPPGFEFDKYLPAGYLSCLTFLNEKLKRYECLVTAPDNNYGSKEWYKAVEEQLIDLASFAVLSLTYVKLKQDIVPKPAASNLQPANTFVTYDKPKSDRNEYWENRGCYAHKAPDWPDTKCCPTFNNDQVCKYKPVDIKV